MLTLWLSASSSVYKRALSMGRQCECINCRAIYKHWALVLQHLSSLVMVVQFTASFVGTLRETDTYIRVLLVIKWSPWLEGRSTVRACWKFSFGVELITACTDFFVVYAANQFDLPVYYCKVSVRRKGGMTILSQENAELLLPIFIFGLKPGGILQPYCACFGMRNIKKHVKIFHILWMFNVSTDDINFVI